MKKIVMTIIAVGLSMNTLVAQTLVIEEKTTSTGSSSHGTTFKKSYYGRDKVLINDSSQPYKTLFDLSKGKVYLIDDYKRVAMELSQKKFGDMAKAGIGNLATIKSEDIKITKTGKSRVINGLNCQEIIIDIPTGGMKTTVWVAKSSVDLNPYFSFSLKNSFGLNFKKVVQFYANEKVYPIETSTQIYNMGAGYINVYINCQNITSSKSDDSVFLIPSGYKIINIDDSIK